MKTVKIIIIILLLAIFSFVALKEIEWSHKRGDIYPEYSTFRSDSHGTRAFYLMLSNLGFQVKRIEKELWEEKKCSLVFIIEPKTPLLKSWSNSSCSSCDFPVSDEESSCDEKKEDASSDTDSKEKTEDTDLEKQNKIRQEIYERLYNKHKQKYIRYLENGNTVVFLTDNTFEEFLNIFDIKLVEEKTIKEKKSAKEDKNKEEEDKPLIEAQENILTKNTSKISHHSHTSIESDKKGSFTELYLNDCLPIAVHKNVGKGHLIVISAPSIILNSHILENDNLRFLLNIIESYGKKGIIGFDEYHNGFELHEDFTNLMMKYDMELFIIHVFLFFIIFIWYSSSRFGNPKKTEETLRLHYDELLSATAHIYKRNTPRANAALVFAKYTLEELETKGKNTPNTKESLLKIFPYWMKDHLSLSALKCFEIKLNKKLSRLEFKSIIKKIDTFRKENING
ncbi:MAG: hypothetical protein KAI43_02505 [Candidatus Aureabacteria bacterium]|nr:hypothetical protein [Candidatus Auribacterota bacterium]